MTLPPPITSRSNARVKVLRAAFSGNASQPGDKVGVEGATLVLEAHRSGARIHGIFLREGDEAKLPEEALELVRSMEPRQVHVLSAEVFDSAAGTVSPQGIAATVEIPAPAARNLKEHRGTTLVLEDIQDPGNLGTLLRSAEAFGVDEIYVTPGCANQWSPKVIRASAGSIFRKPVRRMPIEDALKLLRAHGVRIAGAVAHSEQATPSPSANLSEPVAIVIGSEGAGLTQQAFALVDERVNIPCRIESLNAAVAGSLLLYEAQRQNAQRIPKKRIPEERIPEQEDGVETV
jgi:TrmH family RNA methyltransferase